MRPRVFKALYSITLGMTVLLAGAANCFSESYDPDPWDDTPPVTVEFSYLVPQVVSLEHATTRGVQVDSAVASVLTHRIAMEISCDCSSPILDLHDRSLPCSLPLLL